MAQRPTDQGDQVEVADPEAEVARGERPGRVESRHAGHRADGRGQADDDVGDLGRNVHVGMMTAHPGRVMPTRGDRPYVRRVEELAEPATPRRAEEPDES